MEKKTNRIGEVSPSRRLYRELEEWQRVVIWPLLSKLKRKYRFPLCEALLRFMHTGERTRFEDVWMNRWFLCLAVEINQYD